MTFKSLAEAGVLALSGLVVALALSWLLLAQFNFSYGFWHDHAGVGAAIDRFAPNNHFRHGFHLATREQRLELFAGINQAIHQQGKGLAELVYEVPGHPQQTLLREPEIVHLTDVAKLISVCRLIVLVVALIWLGLWIYYWQARRAPPSLRHQLLGTFAFVFLVALAVVLIGPVKVFYALHIWLFPEEHQWFFYYEESLMSTMMLAPDLFGWIAVEWTLLAIIFFVGLQAGAAKLVVQPQPKVDHNKKGAEAPRKNGARTKNKRN
jgi:hypothetical protein